MSNGFGAKGYSAIWRDEIKLRAYFAGSLLDDIGIASMIWAFELITTNLFVNQAARAKFMIPNLLAFLVGAIIAGPLADWAGRTSVLRLPRWRWKLIFWGRVVETLALGVALISISTGELTIGTLLPYSIIRSFMKTALRPTRMAFEVDLLQTEQIQVDERGQPLLDERGEPRVYKVHLLPLVTTLSFLRTASALGGLLLGAQILAMVNGVYWPILLFDALTNVGFLVFFFFGCHPDRDGSTAKIADLFSESDEQMPLSVRAKEQERSLVFEAVREVLISFREVFSFLKQPAQRPLFFLLFGTALVEFVSESYEGKMMIRHILGGTNEDIRRAEITWSLTSVIVLSLLPLLTRYVHNLGKIFLVTMLLDGAIIALAGHFAGYKSSSLIVPFVVVIAVDKVLTITSGSLAELAQNSASSTALRGRIAAIYAIVVLIGDLIVEGVASAAAETWGIPTMVLRVGFLQIVLVALILILGGRKLWSFGLRHASDPPSSVGT